MKKIILSLFFFPIFISGCSSSSGSGGKTSEDDVAKTDYLSPDYDEIQESQSGDDLSSSEDLSLEDSEGEQGNITAEENFTAENETDEYNDDSYSVEESENSQGDLFNLPESPMTENQEQDLFAQTDEQTDSKDSSLFYSEDKGDPVTDKPKLVPVKKMKDSVYRIEEANINRLYIVRPDDTMKSISMKIYGNDSSAEALLYSYNSHFKGKSLKVGDKIYYSSPVYPDDSIMKTYYEDNNQQPQYYTTREGDNLRKFSKELLGHPRSWMEIYATNENIESKGRLPAGLQIRYWTENPGIQTIAQNPSTEEEPPPPEVSPPEEEVPPPSDPNPVVNPQDQNLAMNENQNTELSDNMDVDDLQENTENLETPPPVVGDINDNTDQNPPPIKDEPAMNEPTIIDPVNKPSSSSKRPMASKKNKLMNFTKDEKLMGALSGLLLLVAIILWILIRRNRSRKVNFEHTHTKF